MGRLCQTDGLTDAWYLTAIDFDNGKTRWRALSGTGFGHNNNFAPVSIGPDRSAYVGEAKGLWLYVISWPATAGYLLAEDLEEDDQLADNIVVIDKGRKIAEGAPRELISRHIEPQVVEVFGDDASGWAERFGRTASEPTTRRPCCVSR